MVSVEDFDVDSRPYESSNREDDFCRMDELLASVRHLAESSVLGNGGSFDRICYERTSSKSNNFICFKMYYMYDKKKHVECWNDVNKNSSNMKRGKHSRRIEELTKEFGKFTHNAVLNSHKAQLHWNKEMTQVL